MVYVGDWESGILELLVAARQSGCAASYPLHSQHARLLPEGNNLRVSVLVTDPLGRPRCILPWSNQRKLRSMHQRLHTKRVKLAIRHGGPYADALLIATKVNAPQNEALVEVGRDADPVVEDFASAVYLGTRAVHAGRMRFA